MSARFLHQHHMRHQRDFDRCFRRKTSAADALLVVYVCPNNLGHPRLGLSVSRRVGPAVRRNRWKRLIREAFRLERERLPEGYDLVTIPRPAAEPTLAGLRESLVAVAGRAARRKPRGAASSEQAGS